MISTTPQSYKEIPEPPSDSGKNNYNRDNYKCCLTLTR